MKELKTLHTVRRNFKWTEGHTTVLKVTSGFGTENFLGKIHTPEVLRKKCRIWYIKVSQKLNSMVYSCKCSVWGLGQECQGPSL